MSEPDLSYVFLIGAGLLLVFGADIVRRYYLRRMTAAVARLERPAYNRRLRIIGFIAAAGGLSLWLVPHL